MEKSTLKASHQAAFITESIWSQHSLVAVLVVSRGMYYEAETDAINPKASVRDCEHHGYDQLCWLRLLWARFHKKGALSPNKMPPPPALKLLQIRKGLGDNPQPLKCLKHHEPSQDLTLKWHRRKTLRPSFRSFIAVDYLILIKLMYNKKIKKKNHRIDPHLHTIHWWQYCECVGF